MADWITDHHELCDGTECNRWDCAALPENVGQWRTGEVIDTRDDGSVEVEWSDGTRSLLPRAKGITQTARDSWADNIRSGKDRPCGDPMCACSTIELEDPK